MYMAHEKVFVVCEDMCMEEGMTKEEINTKFTDCKVKGDFAILTGQITLPEANSGSTNANVKLSYPTDFTKDNCVVVSLMANNVKYANFGYSTTGVDDNSTQQMKGAYGLEATFKASEILVNLYKIDDTAPSITSDVRLVLMKIS